MEGEGFTCAKKAPSGVEALELMAKLEPAPLVLSDYHMPRMDGGELLRRSAGRSLARHGRGHDYGGERC